MATALVGRRAERYPARQDCLTPTPPRRTVTPYAAGFSRREAFAMSGRRHALKLAFLTAALGLVALCVVALACAPGAPVGPGGAVGGAVDAESTNTPTPEPTVEAGTEATSAPALPSTPSPTDTAAPTPTPTPTPEPGAARLGPIVGAWVQGQATRQATAQAQGASGLAAPAGLSPRAYPLSGVGQAEPPKRGLRRSQIAFHAQPQQPQLPPRTHPPPELPRRPPPRQQQQTASQQ